MAREIVNLNDLFNAGCAVPRVLDKNTNAYDAKDGSLYFVRSYIEGPTLDWAIAESGPWDGAHASEMIEALAKSLRIALELGFVHGDLRPENIIIESGETARYVILNYGLTFDRTARSVLAPQSGAQRARFLDLPESMLDDIAPSPVTDITGLVALAFYALTAEIPKSLVGSGGRAPHQRDPESLEGRFARANQFVAAQAFFEQGFARRPEDRFQTITEFLASWRRLTPPVILSAEAFGLSPKPKPGR